MNWRPLARLIFAGKPVLADPFGLNAALAERKANRDQLRAAARSEAARKGWQTRRAGA